MDARTSWMLANREEVNEALREGLRSERLEYLIQEAAATAAQLGSAREHLSLLIRENYPMGLTGRQDPERDVRSER